MGYLQRIASSVSTGSFFSLYLQIATVLERDRSKEKVVLELLQSKEIISLHYDNVCEYIGEVEDI